MPGPRSVHLAHLTPTFSSSVSFGQVTKTIPFLPPRLLRNCQTKPKGSTNYGNPEERSMGWPFLFTARCWSVVQRGLGRGHWASWHSPSEHRGDTTWATGDPERATTHGPPVLGASASCPPPQRPPPRLFPPFVSKSDILSS